MAADVIRLAALAPTMGEPTPCALCGADDPTRKVYPPGEWVEYLRVVRDLQPVEGVLAMPLCRGCNDRVAPLRDAYRDLERLDGGHEAVHERVTATLDRVDLDALTEETGPTRAERRRLDGDRRY